MKGLELSRSYFENFGKTMLEEFPDILPKIAAGLCGSGSECFGFDDDISRDHDFEPGFCIFLPSEETVDRRSAFLLERAYSKLPSEHMGVKRLKIQPVGGPRHGVMRIEDFFKARTGYHGPVALSSGLRPCGSHKRRDLFRQSRADFEDPGRAFLLSGRHTEKETGREPIADGTVRAV